MEARSILPKAANNFSLNFSLLLSTFSLVGELFVNFFEKVCGALGSIPPCSLILLMALCIEGGNAVVSVVVVVVVGSVKVMVLPGSNPLPNIGGGSVAMCVAVLLLVWLVSLLAVILLVLLVSLLIVILLVLLPL